MTVDSNPEDLIDHHSFNTLDLLLNSNTFTCKSTKLNLSFQVHIQNDTNLSTQKCFLMTVHDLGSNHMQFDKFINCPKMTGIRNRVIWLNVTLPGQEPEAETLNIKKFPSLEELGEELVCVLDYLRIPQVVCVGNGVGANISTYFAVKNPSRCLGLVILEPISSSASIIESLRHTFQHLTTKKSSVVINNENKLDQSEQCLFNDNINSINNKNLALFAESFFNRSCLLNELAKLRIDMLIAVGKMSPLCSDSKKFYKGLQELNRKTPLRLVNSPYLEIECCSSIIKDCPDRLATSLQYFLQGIGLISAMPMQKTTTKKMSINSSVICSSNDEISLSSSSSSSH